MACAVAELDIAGIWKMLADQPTKKQVQHCLWEIARNANLLDTQEFVTLRAMEVSYNIGRVESLLPTLNAHKIWWEMYQPFLDFQHWKNVQAQTYVYLQLFELEMPSYDYINRS